MNRSRLCLLAALAIVATALTAAGTLAGALNDSLIFRANFATDFQNNISGGPVFHSAVGATINGSRTVIGNGSAYFATSGTNYINYTATGLPSGAGARSLSFWVYETVGGDSVQGVNYFDYGTSGAQKNFAARTKGSACSNPYWNNLTFTAQGADVSTSVPMGINMWQHVVMTYDGGTRLNIYVNGTFVSNTSITTLNTDTSNNIMRIGMNLINGAIGDGYCNIIARSPAGHIAAVKVWTKQLERSDVAALYANESAGVDPTIPQTVPVSPPTWDSGTPADGAVNSTPATFNVSCGLNSISFWFNGPPQNVSFANTASPIMWTYNWTSYVSSGTYTYKAGCYNSTSGIYSENTTERTWYYDAERPTITINPTNEFDNNNATIRNPYDGIVHLNITFQDNRALYGYIVNITRGGVEAWSYQNTSMGGTNDTTFTRSRTTDGLLNPSITSLGVFNVSVTIADTHTIASIPDYAIVSENSVIRYTPEGEDRNILERTAAAILKGVQLDDLAASIGTDGHNTISISTRDDSTITTDKHTDRYTFNMAFDDERTTTRIIDLETTTCPLTYLPESPYPGHFVTACGVKGNWIDFAGAGEVESVEQVDDYHYTITLSDVPADAKFQSIGGLNERTSTYEVFVGNYTTNTIQSIFTNTSETFLLNITKAIGETTSSVFTYDGVVYNTTKTTGTDTDYYSATVLSKSVTGIVGQSTDETVYYAWNVTYTMPGTSASTFNISGQQTVISWNNTLNITILDATTGQRITQNITVSFTGSSGGFSYTTTSGLLNRQNLQPDTYTIKFQGANYTQSSYVTTINISGGHQLTAYLQPNGSTVVFTFVDGLSGSIISDIGVLQQTTVNGTWQTITSKYSDVTGKAAFSYVGDSAYRFVCAKAGYTTKTFTLDGILYTTYEVRMQRDTANSVYTDYTGVLVTYEPKTFYADRQNNLSIGILSPLGVLQSYNYTITYPGGSQTGSGTTSTGETFSALFNASTATWQDRLNISITYTPSNGVPRRFTYSHGFTVPISNYTFVANKDRTYGMGLVERYIIGSIIIIVSAGIATMAIGSLPGFVVGLIIAGVWVYIGFWSFWAIGISMVVGIALIAARSN